MTTLQVALVTIWTSLVALGWIKSLLAVVIIIVIARAQSFLGLIAALLFIAYLLHWF